MATYAAKRKTVFIKLRLPNSVPYIFVALKVAVPASIMTTIVSEYFAEYITGRRRSGMYAFTVLETCNVNIRFLADSFL